MTERDSYDLGDYKSINELFEKEVNMLSLQEFKDINESELSCIFAETGGDREMDFDEEQNADKLYYEGLYWGDHPSYSQLKYLKEE